MKAGSTPFGRPEVVVVGEAVGDALRARRARRVGGRDLLEREVEHLRQPAVAHVLGQVDGVVQRHLAEDREVGDPAARAAARIFGTQSPKNAALTCFAVSTRKPSTLKRVIHDE